MKIYNNELMGYDVYFDDMTIDKCKSMYDYISKYCDFDDSINQNFIINDADNDEKILTFYFYGMERDKLYIYGHFDEWNKFLHVIFNTDYDEMDSIIDIMLDSINE